MATDTRDARELTLRELEVMLRRAQAGEVVPVPDGLIETVQRMRADCTLALGPRDGGDVAWLLAEVLRRVERVEAMTLAGRWGSAWRVVLAWVVRSRRWGSAMAREIQRRCSVVR